ncbi:uncharacterized protein LOC115131808 isoform X1 [Oncorhynchus nerka]|uniref:uncharacterized protein LOC115131808 isoform X1 n=1 Tax=Oncorhynchus nerka TaxID=8023 RepID=UPI0011322F7A|nr:uncharacterized protein LOC115131808 isoform X1 [Oncorhynchus nerka]
MGSHDVQFTNYSFFKDYFLQPLQPLFVFLSDIVVVRLPAVGGNEFYKINMRSSNDSTQTNKHNTTVSAGIAFSHEGPWPDRGPMIMGNLVLKNKKARFIVTYKLLQYKYETHVLMIILGYLTQDRKTPLLIQCCGRCARPGAVALCEPGSAAVCGTTE